MAETLTVDYLVIGAGAMGMSFVDTLVSDTKKSIVMVDRYARPGGHWIMAYPFVRLHQPAEYYGVNSRKLGTGKIDQIGWNKGIPELASRDEILSYYDLTMRETFLPSGRVKYFPKHEYLGEGSFKSILTGKTYKVGAGTTIVDATYSQTKVPSMGPPAYEVAEGVKLVTPNDLPQIDRGYANYTVVGAGKTGIDSALWLIENGIPQSDITWIMPRDSLFFKRTGMEEFGKNSMKANESVMAANTVDEVARNAVGAGQLMYFDPKAAPATMWHCATISELEMEALRKIGDIVRKGRVTKITSEEVTLTKGSYKPKPDTLFIDCSASAVHKAAPVPIFQDKKIVLQPVRYCQQTFSSAVIAHVEATYDDLEKKNYLCSPIPMPNVLNDMALIQVQTNTNALRWAQHPKTQAFVSSSRLDLFGSVMPKPPSAEPEVVQKFYAELLGGVSAVTERLKGLMEELEEPEASRMRNELENTIQVHALPIHSKA